MKLFRLIIAWVIWQTYEPLHWLETRLVFATLQFFEWRWAIENRVINRLWDWLGLLPQTPQEKPMSCYVAQPPEISNRAWPVSGSGNGPSIADAMRGALCGSHGGDSSPRRGAVLQRGKYGHR